MFRSAESISLLITAVSAVMLAIAIVTADSSPTREPAPAGRAGELDVSEAVPLDVIQNPAAVLPSMPVETSSGDMIGNVRSVEVGPDGRVQTVTFTTRGWFGLVNALATISADDLVYMRGRSSLVSRLTHTEIAARASTRVKARL